MSRIDPRRFTGLQLVPTTIAPDDYAIAIGGLRAGRIMRQRRAFGKEAWFWTVTGPALVQAGIASSGEAETLEEARQAFRSTFDTWLRWAMTTSGPVMWHGSASPDGL